MERSSFISYIETYLNRVATEWPTRVNDSRKALTYLYKSMLTPMFSPTDQWESFGANQTIVAADYVALDSELPLKMRDSLGSFKGDIPKVGMAIPLGENEKKRIRLMRQTNQPLASYAGILTNDVEKVISGVWEANEDAFLRLLSDGVCVIADPNRPGVGIRIALEIRAENIVNPTAAWDLTNAAPGNTVQPITFIRETINKARDINGDILTHIALSETMMDFIGRTDEGKALVASNMTNRLDTDVSKMGTPYRADVEAAFLAKLGLTVVNTTRSIRYEKNGKQTVVKPYNDAHMTLMTTAQVGTLWYGTVEESESPVANVSYATSDSYILVSMYRNTNPLSETTASQAVVIPMLDNVNSIYWLHTEAAAIKASVEGGTPVADPAASTKTATK